MINGKFFKNEEVGNDNTNIEIIWTGTTSVCLERHVKFLVPCQIEIDISFSDL